MAQLLVLTTKQETPKKNNSEKGTEVERNEDEMIVVDPKIEEPKQACLIARAKS